MSKRKRNYVPLSDEDRLDLVPTAALVMALERRFSGKGCEIALFARQRIREKTETFCVDHGNTVMTDLMRFGWTFIDSYKDKPGDTIHKFEDGEWMTHVLGEETEDKDTP